MTANIFIYIQRSNIHPTIIRKIGEAKSLIHQHKFVPKEIDISEDFAKQKQLLKDNNGKREYPLFEYENQDFELVKIGNLEALKDALEGSQWLLKETDNALSALSDVNLKEEEQKVETVELPSVPEKKEPELGFISQNLQVVDNLVRAPVTWFTSWFYAPTVETVTPIPPSDVNTNNDDKNNDNNHNDNTTTQPELEVNIEHNELAVNITEKNDKSDVSASDENKGENEELKDFKVVQTNWYWRQQVRMIRINTTKKEFFRYNPDDLSIRAKHSLSLLKELITDPAQYYLQLNFLKEEGSAALVYEYYTTSATDYPIIMELLKAHSNAVVTNS